MQNFKEKRFKSTEEMKMSLKIGDIIRYKSKYMIGNYFLAFLLKTEQNNMNIFVFNTNHSSWFGFKQYTMIGESTKYTKLEFYQP